MIKNYLSQMLEIQESMRENIDFSRLKFWSVEQIVLKYGRQFVAPTRERNLELMEQYNIPYGIPKECYSNAGKAVLAKDLIYVEGFAASVFPVQHAWVVTPEGEMFDPTWIGDPKDKKRISPRIGTDYFGVPLSKNYFNKTICRTHIWGVFDYSCNRKVFAEGIPEEALALEALEV